jgi:hypothetical protein
MLRNDQQLAEQPVIIHDVDDDLLANRYQDAAFSVYAR